MLDRGKNRPGYYLAILTESGQYRSCPSYRPASGQLSSLAWQTAATFHQEQLLVHMIVVCLFRIATLEASHLAKLSVGQLSFARERGQA